MSAHHFNADTDDCPPLEDPNNPLTIIYANSQFAIPRFFETTTNDKEVIILDDEQRSPQPSARNNNNNTVVIDLLDSDDDDDDNDNRPTKSKSRENNNRGSVQNNNSNEKLKLSTPVLSSQAHTQSQPQTKLSKTTSNSFQNQRKSISGGKETQSISSKTPKYSSPQTSPQSSPPQKLPPINLSFNTIQLSNANDQYLSTHFGKLEGVNPTVLTGLQSHSNDIQRNAFEQSSLGISIPSTTTLASNNNPSVKRKAQSQLESDVIVIDGNEHSNRHKQPNFGKNQKNTTKNNNFDTELVQLPSQPLQQHSTQSNPNTIIDDELVRKSKQKRPMYQGGSEKIDEKIAPSNEKRVGKEVDIFAQFAEEYNNPPELYKVMETKSTNLNSNTSNQTDSTQITVDHKPFDFNNFGFGDLDGNDFELQRSNNNSTQTSILPFETSFGHRNDPTNKHPNSMNDTDDSDGIPDIEDVDKRLNALLQQEQDRIERDQQFQQKYLGEIAGLIDEMWSPPPASTITKSNFDFNSNSNSLNNTQRQDKEDISIFTQIQITKSNNLNRLLGSLRPDKAEQSGMNTNSQSDEDDYRSSDDVDMDKFVAVGTFIEKTDFNYNNPNFTKNTLANPQVDTTIRCKICLGVGHTAVSCEYDGNFFPCAVCGIPGHAVDSTTCPNRYCRLCYTKHPNETRCPDLVNVAGHRAKKSELEKNLDKCIDEYLDEMDLTRRERSKVKLALPNHLAPLQAQIDALDSVQDSPNKSLLYRYLLSMALSLNKGPRERETVQFKKVERVCPVCVICGSTQHTTHDCEVIPSVPYVGINRPSFSTQQQPLFGQPSNDLVQNDETNNKTQKDGTIENENNGNCYQHVLSGKISQICDEFISVNSKRITLLGDTYSKAKDFTKKGTQADDRNDALLLFTNTLKTSVKTMKKFQQKPILDLLRTTPSPFAHVKCMKCGFYGHSICSGFEHAEFVEQDPISDGEESEDQTFDPKINLTEADSMSLEVQSGPQIDENKPIIGVSADDLKAANPTSQKKATLGSLFDEDDTPLDAAPVISTVSKPSASVARVNTTRASITDSNMVNQELKETIQEKSTQIVQDDVQNVGTMDDNETPTPKPSNAHNNEDNFPTPQQLSSPPETPPNVPKTGSSSTGNIFNSVDTYNPVILPGCTDYLIFCTICAVPGHLAYKCPESYGNPNANPSKDLPLSFDIYSEWDSITARAISTGQRCRTCNRTGHFSAKCPSRKCFKCGKTGHDKWECPKGGRSSYSNSNTRDMTCYTCRQVGHFSANCPEAIERTHSKSGKTGKKDKSEKKDKSGKSDKSDKKAKKDKKHNDKF
jgi:hypothetical protein